MREITKYKAEDDSEFTSKESCLDHEVNCDVAASTMRHLDKNPSDSAFSNGSGYIQHDPSKVITVRNLFLEFSKRYTDHNWIQQTIDGEDIHISYADRILGEVLPASIYRHWSRFSCIDDLGREWGQPFYANNPDKATQKQLN